MISKAKTIRRLVCGLCRAAIGTGGLCSYSCENDNRHEDERPSGAVVIAIYVLTEERPYTKRAAQRLDDRTVKE